MWHRQLWGIHQQAKSQSWSSGQGCLPRWKPSATNNDCAGIIIAVSKPRWIICIVYSTMLRTKKLFLAAFMKCFKAFRMQQFSLMHRIPDYTGVPWDMFMNVCSLSKFDAIIYSEKIFCLEFVFFFHLFMRVFLLHGLKLKLSCNCNLVWSLDACHLVEY